MQANDNIKKIGLSADKQSEIFEMLQMCQDSAIYIGTSLENQEAELSNIVVPLLEEYCELVFTMSQVTNTVEFNDCLRKTDKLLKTISWNLKEKLPKDKKEAVFFPYKASMWDSLESVWLAASKDEDYEVYVVPIPYFSKASDGTFSEMHYEGREYPENVTITDWEEYDVEARKPDIIFIHNPYDQANLVTSIHPKFYSSELKKYTNKLVYIPYFVASTEVKEHFCVLPGVINAHKVILQSENICNIYKETFLKFIGKAKLEQEEKTGVKDYKYWENLRTYADNKFLPLGSPKIDKVINCRKEDFVLPKEWQDKISVNGVDKKVILFNTSLDTFINTKEIYIDKLEYVLAHFANVSDIVLWWRPHPLFADTVKSMAPELEKRYEKIVQKYIEENWGIYDDTSELNRSIVYSDAYYGDESSVVTLYKETGKPILIQ